MTFDDDHMIFVMLTGRPKRVFLRQVKFEWPPPLIATFMGFPFRRVSMSTITDEERKTMTNVCRGAEYHALEEQPAAQDAGTAAPPARGPDP